HVKGIDISADKIDMLQKGYSYLSDLTNEEVVQLMNSGRFTPTVDFSAVSDVDVIIICVPTPLTNKEPDLSFIYSAVDQITPYLRENQIIVLESSTYPGTTDEKIKPRLESTGKKIGTNLFLAYSPERIDPGNKSFTLVGIPKIISGVTEQCLSKITSLYSTVFKQVVPVSSTKVAEFAKLLENSQRLINISFVNEANILAHRLGINLWEVIEAAKTKPMGFMPYYPSAGAGGHCIPVDPYYLSWVGFQEGVPQ